MVFVGATQSQAALKFASYVPAVQSGHWMAYLTIIIMGALFIFSLYLITRTLLTANDKISSAPGHIINAIPILKWIGVSSILLAIVGSAFDVYHQLLRLGISGACCDLNQTAGIVGVILVFLILASLAGLAALGGIGLIFIKQLRHQKSINVTSSVE